MREATELFCANCGKQIHKVEDYLSPPEYYHNDGMFGCNGVSGFGRKLRAYEEATPLTPKIALKALYACIIKDNQAD